MTLPQNLLCIALVIASLTACDVASFYLRPGNFGDEHGEVGLPESRAYLQDLLDDYVDQIRQRTEERFEDETSENVGGYGFMEFPESLAPSSSNEMNNDISVNKRFICRKMYAYNPLTGSCTPTLMGMRLGRRSWSQHLKRFV